MLSLFAALCHEAGHLFAMKVTGSEVKRITVYPFGLDIRTGKRPCSYRIDLFLYLSGIAVNALLAIFCIILMPMLPHLLTEATKTFLFANLLLFFVNILPHPRLDGGCALRSFLLLFWEEDRVDRVCLATGDFILLPLLVIGAYLLFYGMGNPTVYLLCAYLLFTAVKEGSRA